MLAALDDHRRSRIQRVSHLLIRYTRQITIRLQHPRHSFNILGVAYAFRSETTNPKLLNLKIPVQKRCKCCFAEPASAVLQNLQVLFYRTYKCCFTEPTSAVLQNLQVLFYRTYKCEQRRAAENTDSEPRSRPTANPRSRPAANEPTDTAERLQWCWMRTPAANGAAGRQRTAQQASG